MLAGVPRLHDTLENLTHIIRAIEDVACDKNWSTRSCCQHQRITRARIKIQHLALVQLVLCLDNEPGVKNTFVKICDHHAHDFGAKTLQDRS